MSFNDVKTETSNDFIEKENLKHKFDFCFSSRNSVFLRGTLNETLAA